MSKKCKNCGKGIEGTQVTTSEGHYYHYKCIEIDYPKPSMPEDMLERLTSEGTGEEVIRLFEYFMKNPYNPIDLESENPLESFPNVYARFHPTRTLTERLKRVFSPVVIEDEMDISPYLVQAIYFGAALERKYPAGAEVDMKYPKDEARVPPEEETNE